jgi:hypothetical protein
LPPISGILTAKTGILIFPILLSKSTHRLMADRRSVREARVCGASRRSDEKSEASRAVVHRRLDEVVDRVGKVETSIVTVQEDVTEMKPVTDEVRRWKLMGMGALAVTGVAAMALGVTFSEALKRIGMVLIGKG